MSEDHFKTNQASVQCSNILPIRIHSSRQGTLRIQYDERNRYQPPEDERTTSRQTRRVSNAQPSSQHESTLTGEEPGTLRVQYDERNRYQPPEDERTTSRQTRRASNAQPSSQHESISAGKEHCESRMTSGIATNHRKMSEDHFKTNQASVQCSTILPT
ncbi:hypothetical protein BP6252_07344 [Coleophoma cylindrospora]|uniref:Uncharacterized protein n=1 Tax=Coleophoma cylindrospora TaxID=1849047 RepID=A0A3D8RHC8_9HELO|nr:hypothetical protein BP6252_07344 [Coleophoma cylindrospora]